MAHLHTPITCLCGHQGRLPYCQHSSSSWKLRYIVGKLPHLERYKPSRTRASTQRKIAAQKISSKSFLPLVVHFIPLMIIPAHFMFLHSYIFHIKGEQEGRYYSENSSLEIFQQVAFGHYSYRYKRTDDCHHGPASFLQELRYKKFCSHLRKQQRRRVLVAELAVHTKTLPQQSEFALQSGRICARLRYKTVAH